jgi:predicted nucleic acid-binding protein
MASYYHDSSALIKHYHAELGTSVVDQLLAEPNALHFLSRLSSVEVPAAFAKKVRTREILSADFQRLYHKFLADMTNPRYRILRLLVRRFSPLPRGSQRGWSSPTGENLPPLTPPW